MASSWGVGDGAQIAQGPRQAHDVLQEELPGSGAEVDFDVWRGGVEAGHALGHIGAKAAGDAGRFRECGAEISGGEFDE
jgi:hypothetical protein